MVIEQPSIWETTPTTGEPSSSTNDYSTSQINYYHHHPWWTG
jgi:hypothetical protein